MMVAVDRRWPLALKVLSVVLLSAASAVLGPGCDHDRPRASSHPPAAGPSPEAQPATGKPEAPVNFAVGPIEPGRLHGPVTLALRLSPRADAAMLTLGVSAEGVVQLAGQSATATTWDGVPAGSMRQLVVTFTCPQAGAGSVAITARVTGRDGVTQTRAAVVDVVAWDDEVLSGTNGRQQLQLEHLDHQLARGLIDDAAYQQQRAAVLGGGATEGP